MTIEDYNTATDIIVKIQKLDNCIYYIKTYYKEAMLLNG